jgi:hypothetical protein
MFAASIVWPSSSRGNPRCAPTTQLGEDVAHVAGDGLLADVKIGGDAPIHRDLTIRVVAGEKGGGGQEVEVRSVEPSPMVGGIQQLKRVLPGPAGVGLPAPDEVVRRPHSASFRHERRLLQALVVEISPIQGESASTKISPYPVD